MLVNHCEQCGRKLTAAERGDGYEVCWDCYPWGYVCDDPDWCDRLLQTLEAHRRRVEADWLDGRYSFDSREEANALNGHYLSD